MPELRASVRIFVSLPPARSRVSALARYLCHRYSKGEHVDRSVLIYFKPKVGVFNPHTTQCESVSRCVLWNSHNVHAMCLGYSGGPPQAVTALPAEACGKITVTATPKAGDSPVASMTVLVFARITPPSHRSPTHAEKRKKLKKGIPLVHASQARLVGSRAGAGRVGACK